MIQRVAAPTAARTGLLADLRADPLVARRLPARVQLGAQPARAARLQVARAVLPELTAAERPAERRERLVVSRELATTGPAPSPHLPATGRVALAVSRAQQATPHPDKGAALGPHLREPSVAPAPLARRVVHKEREPARDLASPAGFRPMRNGAKLPVTRWTSLLAILTKRSARSASELRRSATRRPQAGTVLPENRPRVDLAVRAARVAPERAVAATVTCARRARHRPARVAVRPAAAVQAPRAQAA